MRGKLMRLFTEAQHKDILDKHSNNVEAAKRYTEICGDFISPQNVKYWRSIFVEHDGNLSGTDRELKQSRILQAKQPDDDIGTCLIPEEAGSILIIPDQHAPYEHPDLLSFLYEVQHHFQPNVVVNLGDELDYHALSFHDSDPNLDSAGAELERGKRFLWKLEKMFPNMLICHSNHGSMQFRRAKAHGIPVQLIKSYRQALFKDGDGQGWSWSYSWTLQTRIGPVLFKHQASGDVVSDAAHNGVNLCVGHEHGKFDIHYAASSARLYWGMHCGCGIDKDSMAFAYGKHSLKKPILGCGVILEGRPMLIPMILRSDGRWIGHL